MRVLILEPHASGHHASYLRWLVEAAVRKQWNVVIATTAAALDHPSLTTIAADFADVRTHLIDAFPNFDGVIARPSRLIRRELAYWKAFKRTVAEVRRRASIDAAILPYVDYCFYALAMLGPPFQDLPWCGISMRLEVRQDAPSTKPVLPLKWRVAKRVLSGPTLSALFVINPSVQDVPPDWLSTTSLSKLRYLPDPAEFEVTGARPESRAALGISDSDVAILVFGSIDERKGIDSLVSCILSHASLANYVVILAGRQSAGVQGQLRTPPCAELRSRNRLIVIDRFLPVAEQNLVFTAADVVWVGYRRHSYMSGVLVIAGRAGLPVVGTAEGEIGRLIAKHNLGVVARIDRPEEVDRALHAMLDAHTRVQMGQLAQSAFASHTTENFGATVMAAIQSSQNI